MSSELLLINPRKRRTHAKKRAHNPIRRRVHHKVHALHSRTRRRRNPISLKGEGISEMVKNAVVAGAGSVAVDAIMGQVRPMLPEAIRTGYAYAATKGAVTILLGILGKKALGKKAVAMAEGALTVQAANLITSFVPSSMTLAGSRRILANNGMRGLGYSTPGSLLPMQANRQVTTARVFGGGLSGFARQGGSSVRTREGVGVR